MLRHYTDQSNCISMKTFFKLFVAIVFVLNFFTANKANAWGRQGHSLIGETSARVIAKELNFEILFAKAYDVGYYSNVPDLIWKKNPNTYKIERFNHYMDLDLFKNQMIKPKDLSMYDFLLQEFRLDRVEFNKKYPQIENAAGRSFWRIRELEEKLTQITQELKSISAMPIAETQNKRFELQKDWLKYIGFISHYVADLGQPLHVTSNFDGGKSNQPGIHSHYEDKVVDELTPALRVQVLEGTQKKWREFHKKNASRSTTELLLTLTENSESQIEPLLKTDQKIGRSDIKKSSDAHKAQILERMIDSSLVLAEIISRQLGWQSDMQRFFTFEAEPPFVGYPK